MSKKVWSMPSAIVEEFVANEFIAACWAISCIAGEADNGQPTADPHDHHTFFGEGTWHTKKYNPDTGCGHAKNQFIREGGDGYIMTEINSEQGTLACTLYTTDWKSVDPNGWTNLTAGQTVYWSTDIGFWNMYHYGVVNFQDKTRPLHS